MVKPFGVASTGGGTHTSPESGELPRHGPPVDASLGFPASEIEPLGTEIASRGRARVINKDQEDESPSKAADAIIQAEGLAEITARAEMQELIQGAIDGTLPLPANLPANFTKKLSPKAIQVVLLRLAGYKNFEIAAIAEFTKEYVSSIVRHPYARRILALSLTNTAVSQIAANRTLQRRSQRMLKIADDIANNVKVDPPVRLRAAFGWLDRARGGPKVQVDHNHNHEHSGRVTVTHRRSKLIARAIREANGLPSADVVEGEFEEVDPNDTEHLENQRAS